MARTNNYGVGIIGPSGPFLDRMLNPTMQDREHMRIKQHELTMQDALLEEEERRQTKKKTKKVRKHVASQQEESSDSKRKGTLETDSSSTQRTQQQSSINKESSRGEACRNLPLREAVILSEIIGQPRCKSRYQRRGSR